MDTNDNVIDEPKLSLKKRIIIFSVIFISAVVLGIIGTFAVLTYFVPVKILESSVVYELGEEISYTLKDYVSGNKYALEVTEMDMSSVKENQVGTYLIPVTHAFQKETFEIVIEDTTPPEITVNTDDIYLQNNCAYDIGYFVFDSYDLSGEVEVEITTGLEGDGYGNAVCYKENGAYDVIVCATDANGNVTKCRVPVIVDTPPVLSGTEEYYVACGFELDYETHNVKSVDETDGDLTYDIKVDATNVDLTAAGDYEIIYTSTDKYGFSSHTTSTVHVLDRLDLQEKINRKELHRNEDNIVGAYNLYDSGTFESSDIKMVLETFEPSIVVIVIPNKSRGSGYIVKITDEEIIICTNRHVTSNKDNLEISFYDGTTVKGETVGSMDGIDVSFVSVKRADLSKEFVETLMTVHINKGYVDTIDNPQNVSVGFRTLKTDGTVWKKDKTGHVIEIKTDEYLPNNYMPKCYSKLKYITTISAAVYSGSSGSAVFDGYGNLIAMVSYIYTYAGEKHYCAITLEDILTGYIQFFDEELNYY